MKTRPVFLLFFSLLLLHLAESSDNVTGFKNGFLTRIVKLPKIMKGFTLEKLQSLRKSLGENKWVRLKHLFILNPHLPILALTGHDITKEDVKVKPSWMSAAIADHAEAAEIQDAESAMEVGASSSSAAECGSGICSLPLNASLLGKSSASHLCIHFGTGLIGDCSHSSGASVCSPSQVLSCHPVPQLASAIIDALTPLRDGRKLPILLLPKQNDLNDLRKAKVIEVDQLSNFVHAEMQDYMTYHEQTPNFGEQVLNTLRNVVQDVSFFIGKSIEDVQRFFNEIQNPRPAVALVTYHELQPLNSLQKAEVVNIVKSIIKDVIEDLEKKMEDQDKIDLRTKVKTEGIAKSLEMLIECNQDNDDILTQVAQDEHNSSMMIFSDSFKSRIDSLVKLNSRRAERQIEIYSFLENVAKMKQEALVSAKETIADILESFTEKKKVNIDDEILKASGSSSWPWFPNDHVPKTCTCLRQLTKITGFWMTQEDPCTQAIPWCFVSPTSGCPDLDHKFKLGHIQLYWSQQACSNEKNLNIHEPLYF